MVNSRWGDQHFSLRVWTCCVSKTRDWDSFHLIFLMRIIDSYKQLHFYGYCVSKMRDWDSFHLIFLMRIIDSYKQLHFYGYCEKRVFLKWMLESTLQYWHNSDGWLTLPMTSLIQVLLYLLGVRVTCDISDETISLMWSLKIFQCNSSKIALCWVTFVFLNKHDPSGPLNVECWIPYSSPTMRFLSKFTAILIHSTHTKTKS